MIAQLVGCRTIVIIRGWRDSTIGVIAQLVGCRTIVIIRGWRDSTIGSVSDYDYH